MLLKEHVFRYLLWFLDLYLMNGEVFENKMDQGQVLEKGGGGQFANQNNCSIPNYTFLTNRNTYIKHF